MRVVAVAIFSLLAGACTTVSFAPPGVDTAYDVADQPQSTCIPDYRAVAEGKARINRDVEGAMALTNNFVMAYRCALQESANGRQVFEIPAFLAAATGLIGSQFGLDADGVLAAGAAASVLGSGKSYWAPAEKQPLVDSALGALLCIKTEQVGIGHFDTTKPEQAQEEVREINKMIADSQAELTGLQLAEKARGVPDKPLSNRIERVSGDLATLQELRTAALAKWANAQVSAGEIGVSAQRQYFEMVGAALFSVERVLGSRLAGVGETDSSVLLAKIKETVQDADDAEGAADAQEKAMLQGGANLIGKNAQEQRSALVRLKNEELQAKLQVCVQQAHL